MNVATPRPLSAADLNFNPARFPLGRLADFAREHWGVEGELTPLDGERDHNTQVHAADGARHMVRLLSWIPGTPLSRGLRGLFHPHARHFVAWDIQRALLLTPGVQAWVADDTKALCADFNARLPREVLPRLPALRAQIVHGDGHADNLLRAGPDTDEIVGVIDFGDMVHAPLVRTSR